jgi:hypothetical protein
MLQIQNDTVDENFSVSKIPARKDGKIDWSQVQMMTVISFYNLLKALQFLPAMQ